MFIIQYHLETKKYYINCEFCGFGMGFIQVETPVCPGCKGIRKVHAKYLTESQSVRRKYYREGSQHEKGDDSRSSLPH